MKNCQQICNNAHDTSIRWNDHKNISSINEFLYIYIFNYSITIIFKAHLVLGPLLGAIAAGKSSELSTNVLFLYNNDKYI